jgi:hypothetical protein
MDDHQQEAREALQDRITAANAEINAVLAKHGVRIAPYMRAERIGEGPLQRMLVESHWAVIPE